MTDQELLNRWQTSSDRQALDDLIRRRLDFVFATARRELGDAHQAEDVTQAVFLLLAQKARSISGDRLAGWLFQTTRYVAANARKVSLRRAYHERQAARAKAENLMSLPPFAESDSEVLVPLLNDAIASLKPKDREAIILRYLQGRDIPAVCAQLGGSEGAVRKRISRAIEALRAFMAAEGITAASGTAPVIAALTVAAQETAPGHLTAATLSAACAGATPAVAAISKGVAIGVTKAKLAIALTLSLAFVGVISAVLVNESAPTPPVNSGVATTPQTLPASDADPRNVLDRIHNAMTPAVPRYYSVFHADDRTDRTDSPNVRLHQTDDARMYRDGDNVDVVEDLRFQQPGHPSVTRVIHRRAIAARAYVGYDTNGTDPPKRGLFNPDGPSLHGIPVAYLGGGDALEGYLGGDDRPFWEILSQYSELHVETQPSIGDSTQPAEPGQAEVLHLWGSGFHGRYDLWCEPTTYALCAVKVVKHDGDKVWGSGTVGKPIAPIAPKQFLDAFWFDMKVTGSTNDAPFHRLDRGELTTYQHWNSGGQITMHTTIRRTAFEPNPDFTARGAFWLDLKDGTPMVGLNLPGGGKFVWRNGRIELLPSTAAPGSLYAAMQSSGASGPAPSWSILGDSQNQPTQSGVVSKIPSIRTSASQGRGKLEIAAAVFVAIGLVVALLVLARWHSAQVKASKS